MEKDVINEYYASGIERNRLELDIFKLEGLRTKEIIARYLTGKELNILDIGGGAGYYSFWLQRSGHQVTLVDLSPENITIAKEFAAENGLELKACETGDATDLNFPNDQFDLVLMLGPLYHLTERKDRIKALTEAKRVLKPGGIILAAFISRYASLFDGFKRDLVTDGIFEKMLIQDLKTGVHINESDNPEYFTTAFFHTPAEIKNEILETGLNLEKLLAIESVGWVIDGLTEKVKDESYLPKINRLINIVESNDDLIAMSPHIMAIAQKT